MLGYYLSFRLVLLFRYTFYFFVVLPCAAWMAYHIPRSTAAMTGSGGFSINIPVTEAMQINKPHLAYAILGGFTTLFMLCSLFIKEKLYIGESSKYPNSYATMDMANE